MIHCGCSHTEDQHDDDGTCMGLHPFHPVLSDGTPCSCPCDLFEPDEISP